MKCIGLIGGMSWTSSIVYYRIINELVSSRLGGLHSSQCVMYSFDFAEIVRLQREAQWEQATEKLVEAARAVEQAGAELAVICTNTMHKMFDAVQAAVGLRMIHIADPTADRVKAAGIKKIGLLATRFTMEHDFYTGRLTQRHGLQVLTPDPARRQIVHDIIFDELCRGIVRNESREQLTAMIAEMAGRGAQGVILGCTELGLLIEQQHSPLPLFDTTHIHAEAAAEQSLNGHL